MRFEFAADRVQDVTDQGRDRPRIGLVATAFWRCVRYLFQAPEGVGSACGRRMVGHAAKMVADFVACDRPEPAPKAVVRAFVTELVNVSSHRFEDFLDHIGGIMIAQFALPCPMKDHGAIQGGKPPPCVGISSDDPAEQARRGRCDCVLSVGSFQTGIQATPRPIAGRSVTAISVIDRHYLFRAWESV